jgi:hypothetical protein
LKIPIAALVAKQTSLVRCLAQSASAADSFSDSALEALEDLAVREGLLALVDLSVMLFDLMLGRLLVLLLALLSGLL